MRLFWILFGFFSLLAMSFVANVAYAKAFEIEKHLAQSQIIDLNTQQILTSTQWLAKLSTQDYIILEEYHNNITQHQLAFWLLQSLHGIRPQGSLLLEMLKTDQQPLIDTLTLNPPNNPDDIAHRIHWQNSWNWQLYGKMVKHAIDQRYPLVATNLSKMEVEQIKLAHLSIAIRQSPTGWICPS